MYDSKGILRGKCKLCDECDGFVLENGSIKCAYCWQQNKETKGLCGLDYYDNFICECINYFHGVSR